METVKKKVSVVMALYNGEKFLNGQLDSILPQLDREDELLVMDDGSTDSSLEIVRAYQKAWPQIRLMEGAHIGVNANFFRGIQEAKGDLILLSDQDDIWLPQKTAVIRNKLESEEGPVLLMHDASIVKADGLETGERMNDWRAPKRGFWTNWWKNRYTGCRMAMTKEMAPVLKGSPADLPMYDQWIGLLAERFGKVIFLDEVLMLYRRHDGNVTDMNRRGLKALIRDRAKLLARYIRFVSAHKLLKHKHI